MSCPPTHIRYVSVDFPLIVVFCVACVVIERLIYNEEMGEEMVAEVADGVDHDKLP